MLNRLIPRTHRFHCPDEHLLAAYVDQQLIGAERERVESHLAKCDSCLQQVSFLIKESQSSALSVPPSLVYRAKKLETAGNKTAPFSRKWVTVAAASAVMAIGLMAWREAKPNIEENSTTIATVPHASDPAIPARVNSDAETAVRSASSPDSQPLVLSPQPGAVVHGPDFSIRWEPVPNAAAYEVRIVTADGGLVWRGRVHENSVNPKQTLRAGSKYFVWVRAWLANGKTLQSPAVGFVGG